MKIINILLALLLTNAVLASPFNAVFIEDEGIELTWDGALETEADYFVLENSSNGITYNTLAEIPKRTNPSLDDYKFLDVRHRLGTNYYRLQVVSSTTGIVASFVTFVEALNTRNQVIIFPTPSTTGVVQIFGYNTTFSTLAIDVYDSFGRLVFNETNIVLSENNNWTHQLMLQHLPNGVYYLYYNSDKRLKQHNFPIAILRK